MEVRMEGRETELPPLVQEIVAAYLALVDREAPGLVQGLYLTGSVALSDSRPGASDIDFVAVTAAGCDTAAIAALERVHGTLAARYRRPFFDGVYVTWDQLAHNPLHAAPGPHAHEHRLQVQTSDEPVTWHILAHHGLTMRGPRRQELDIWTDRDVLAAWTRDNLERYWRPWLQRSAHLLSRPGLVCLGSWGPAWGVLGVSRLHYTLATGAITSKDGAGVYALDAFPSRWGRIITECLRLRRGGDDRSLYGTPLTRRRAALAFMDMAIDDALRLPGATAGGTTGFHAGATGDSNRCLLFRYCSDP